MTWKRTALGLAIAGLVLAGGRAEAAPIFYSVPGPTATNDVPFQTAVGGVSETDLESLPLGNITSFVLGGVTVTVSGEIWGAGDYSPNGAPGTVFGQTLLNRLGGAPIPGGLTFSFSSAVLGFGLWVFDNSQDYPDSFSMTANSQTSAPPLDFNPGLSNHTVEGFIGVSDTAGITTVTLNHPGFGPFFEVDHIQLAPLAPTAVPEPATLATLGMGLILAARRRKKKAQP